MNPTCQVGRLIEHLMATLTAASTAQAPSVRPRLYTYAEAADELRIDKSWLQHHIKDLPHAKFGGHVWFSDDDLARIPAIFHREPQQQLTGAPAGPVVAPDAAALHPLPRRRSPRAKVPAP